MPSFTLSRRRAIVAVLGALALIFAAAHLFGPKSQSAVVSVEGAHVPAPGAAPRRATLTQMLVVDVAGEVRRPGLYRLPQGTRIADAIAKAGGATPRADTILVN